jgi:hypothetical protein
MVECTLFNSKKELFGRKIYFDNTSVRDLTEDEIYLIKQFVKFKENNVVATTYIPISRRIQIDFIGYNDKKYNDILICKNYLKKFL